MVTLHDSVQIKRGQGDTKEEILLKIRPKELGVLNIPTNLLQFQPKLDETLVYHNLSHAI